MSTGSVMSNSRLYQIIPSDVCFSCDVCCRFIEEDSSLAPIFTETEKQSVISQGADPTLFQQQLDGNSSQIKLIPYKDFFICPFFEPNTSRCKIYINRPLDCQLYPFALMFNEDRSDVVLGVDMLCPFGEENLETETFKEHIQHVIEFIESDIVKEQLCENWSLIGEYQDTVKVLHTLDYSINLCNSNR